MNTNKIIAQVRAEYERNWKESNLMNSARFQKGGGTSLVLRTPIVRKISAEQFRQVRGLTKSELFEICDGLFEAGFMTIAVDWAGRRSREFEASDIDTSCFGCATTFEDGTTVTGFVPALSAY